MNSCKVLNKNSFIDELLDVCNTGATMDLVLGAAFIKESVKELVENARNSSNPEQQLNILNEALNEFYNNPGDVYGLFLSTMLPFDVKTALFNVNYDNTLAEDKTFSSTFEEKAKASRKQRLKNFISSKFKDAPNAKLYFQRSVLNDIVETFFVKRSGDNPRIFESQEEMNENVRMYKQELLDRIFEYFEENALLKGKVSGLPRKMYTKKGDYTGVIEAVKSVFNSYLAAEAFQNTKVKSLEEFYKDYRDGIKPDVRKNAERFLNAYNAWLMLSNFDTLVRDIIGSTIEIKDDSNYDRHTGDLTKYKIRGKATNIWSNWTNSDDIADMSEVISDVTLYLINTSRMYKWGNDEAYTDRYVSFHDFNYTIGLIKKLVFDPKSNTLALRNLEGIDKVSLHTKKLMLEMIQWNRVNETGDVIINDDGSKTVIPREVTWKQLISRINENPQKYLHAAFDILCNTNILDEFQLNTYEKSLIWSFYKELFGGDQNPRSLFNLHNLTSKDGIYLIITQVAASTFPEDYLQYYEKNDGSIGTRLLKDFALDNIKRNLLDNIQLTGAVLSDMLYKKFGVTYTSRANTNDSYLQEVKIKIKTTSGDLFEISANNLNVRVEFDVNRSDEIWNSPEVRLLFKEILGVNFDADPDLQNAYIEQVSHSSYGLDDLGKLVGRALYTSIINTKYVPKYPKATIDESALKTFLKNQYGESLAKEYNKGIKYDTGYVSVLPVKVKDSALNHLSMAVAINSNILAQAQSKTGEGTALANYTLSRMRNFFQNLIEMQCKRVNSALKNMTFVVNDNNLFEGILSRRELKTLQSNLQSTKFSDLDSFALSFINDFIASFVPDPDPNSYIKNGRASFLPTVNSDKTQIDGLLVNLNAKTKISNGNKTYLELTDAEIEQEMVSEFKPMYDKIIDNINKELLKVYQILPDSIKRKYPIVDQGDVISNNDYILNAINEAYAYDTSLGKNAKKRILNGLHRDITKYNLTHGRNPIMIAPNIHYVFNKDTGLLEGNHTLQALWGRFNSDMSAATRAKLTQMYADEKDYAEYRQRNGLSDPLNVQSFFKYKEHLTIENLLKMKFSIKLFGSDSVVRHDSKEIQFLRGEAKFTEQQLRDPKYQHLQSLNLEMKNWINYENGTMILAKGFIDGVETNITTLNLLRRATSLRIHPMLSKLNRLDYLCSLQYTIATVGSHYAHSGGAGGGSVLVEEAKRWLASNKRNVAATSTVHLFLNKQLDGSPSVYNVAIIEDVTFDLYNVMGDLYKEGHKPLDGGMMVSAFVPDLENNSLAGEKAGLDKKLFGTFFSELYGAGGIVKTAGFAGTNARMRRQKAWLNIQKAMSSKPWTKEFPDENDVDILEVIDITKDYFDNPIDYRAAIKGLHIMYKRPAHDNPAELAAYRLHNIESLGNNQYRIWEVEIDLYGAEISEPIPRKENGSDVITINNNWDLYTKVFGGFNSLEIGSDNRLTWSENSVKLMVHAMNNVGYRKKNDNLMKDAETEFGEEVAAQLKLHNANVKTGLDLDDIWQPLKYSEIHYMPNIGAIKSLQFNVNPDGDAVYEGRAEVNHMVMRLAQLGILLDKEHHADASDVSMPTLIIQATANRSFTSEYTREIYKALNTLTRLVTKPFIEGIKDIITSNDPTALVEEVSNLLVEKLLSKKDDENAVTSILQEILQKAEEGKTLKFAEDLKGKIPWSDPTISSKLFSELSTTLTNLAVKMKFAGTLSVICPTDRIEKIYGDRLLNSFTKIFNDEEVNVDENGEPLLDKYSQFTEEEKAILDKAPRNAEGKLLAPNGQVSNLTEKQYAQVRTKAFKEWFGDWENDPENASKVVDENGEPLVVWHGSRESNSITEFYNRPTYFSDKFTALSYTPFMEVEDSSEYLYPAFLNIRNPKKVNGNGAYWNGINGTSTDNIVESIDKEKEDGAIIESIKDYSDFAPGNPDLAANLLEDTTLSIDYVVINPNQIKLTTDDTRTVRTKSTRTKLTETAITDYQKSVREGKEIDSDGRNMLVYDFNRDNTSNTINKEALDRAHKLILSTLGLYEASFDRLMAVTDLELHQIFTLLLLSYNADANTIEEACLYAKEIIAYVKTSGLTYADFKNSDIIHRLEEFGFNKNYITLLDNIRELYLKGLTEDNTVVLPYSTFKLYEGFLDRLFDISQDFEYNQLQKGYLVSPSILLAINNAIKIFGTVEDYGLLNVMAFAIERPQTIANAKTDQVYKIVSGFFKSQTQRRKTLSKLSELKTLHNYIIEFEDGSQEQITINTPEDYYRVKNLTLKGKKINYTTPIIWAHPAIGKTYSVENGAFSSQIIDWDVEFNRRRDNWIATKTKTLLNSLEFKAARNDYMINWNKYPDYVSFIKQEWERVKQKANDENKILVASPHMLLQLFPLDFNKVLTMSSDDFVARNVARGANNETNSIKWKQGIDSAIQSVTSDPNNNLEVVLISPNDYLENLLLNGSLQTELSLLVDNELVKNHNTPVTKIYEDVETGRALSAYNVRYTDVDTGNRFLIYDLDSINLLFKLNHLMTKNEIKGYELFTNLNEIKLLLIFNQILGSNVFKDVFQQFYSVLSKKYTQIPHFDSNFITNLKTMYPELFVNFINDFYTILKPFVYNYMQTDLKKLSKNYDKADRKVYANGTLIEPTDIETDAYELIMPKIYKTQFGLLEFDDLQTILRDKDFFVKRGLQRFQCKLDHKSYDYELKNFNGEHYYILDKKQGIPDHIALNILQIWTDTRKKKHYRVDSDGNIIYEMSSKDDVVCKLGNVQIIVTDNPLFYVQNLNYNTLKVSPERVTEESYLTLINTLSQSKRTNSKNFLKAISNPDKSYFDLKTFKEFNIAIDKLDYDTVKLGDRNERDFKSVALLCRIILQNGRELHTAFNESLNLIAGRIPAQSQQSFMTQRVIGFDNADLNTAMVSTFQLFLQGSDLDIDAVTLLGYEFDKNGKFVAWSPYFKSDSKEKLEASKDIPLPTGEVKKILADFKASDNFFETYDKYFGTIFKTIPLPTGGIRTTKGVPELMVDLESPDNLKLFALFLRDFNDIGINIKGPVNKNGLIDTNGNVDFYKAPDVTLEDGTTVLRSWNLFTPFQQGGSIGARPELTYAMALQLLDIANEHNNYLNVAEEHLRDKMSKNYIVHYIYKVAEAPCNQTEAMLSVDQSTKEVKNAADNSDMATASNSFAPGGYETKHKSVGEGQVGKSCVGIGAVAIKANSTTQFYLSELWNHGSDWDKEKILFKHPVFINNKYYYGFANMYTSKEFSLQEIEKFTHALNILNSLEDPSQITQDVAVNIASLLSIAVDNAKDLALKKINSGPRLMGLYAYGMTLGIPVNELVSIMNSPLGLIIAEMTEGSVYNNDPSSFKVIDIFSKLDGYIAGDLERFAVTAKGNNNKTIKKTFKATKGNTKQLLEFGKTTDTLFALLYDAYANWFNTDKALENEKARNPKFQIASTLSEMLHLLIQYNAFSKVYATALTSETYKSYTDFLSNIKDPITKNNYKASMGQIIDYIKDIEQKAELFKRGQGRDLRTLAEGAEEMRILGSILSINKGLKPSTVEAEAFIDTIENLIYDRKKVLGYLVSESDKIDFFKFMTDEEYLKLVVDTYEAIKHSVNIPHLLLKSPHFNGYLETQMIPLAFFTATSIKHRIVHKYRKNVEADYDTASEKPVGLFDLLGLESKSDKESALKGLENLIHFKLFTRWAYDKLLKFTVPKDFLFFTKKGTLTFNPDGKLNLLLCTEAGLASFKKYMEEVYIPLLQADPILGTNEFIKNLDKISFDKTSLHNSVTTYSLSGDLMAKSGRLGELNAKMFADFQVLSEVKFQPENGIPSLLDAFYLYAQYVYMGKKGTKSLMNAFDSVNPTLKKSFTKHIALMDSEGHLSCSKEELILWCAPVGTLRSSANYAYVNLGGLFGKSLGIKIQTNIRLDEDLLAAYDLAREDNEEEGQVQRRKENYGVYRPEYLATAYDRLTRNHFLVPSTTEKVAFTETVPLHDDLDSGRVTLLIKLDMVFDCSFNHHLESLIEAKIKDGTVSKFKSVEDFRQTLKSTLKSLHIPYKTTLTSDRRQLIDLGVIETIINHLLNC